VREGQGRLARTFVGQGLVIAQYPNAPDLTDLEVVVPVFNDAENLARLLATLPEVAVTVVDDGSPTTDVAETARRFGARLLRTDANLGPAHARNLGLAVTDHPYVAFLDADVSLDGADQVLRGLLGHFADPMVAAVAPRITGVAGPRWRDAFEARSGPLDLGETSALVVPRGRVSFVPSAVLVVRVEAAGDGFDESLRIGEDVDFVWRLSRAGWLVYYDAALRAHHNPRAQARAWLAQRYRYGTSAAELARRHPGTLHPVRADLWTVMAWAALLARQPRLALSVTAMARQQMMARLPAEVGDAEGAATTIVVRGMAESGGPLARQLVRAYLPLLLLALRFRPLRLPVAAVLVTGVAWRWRGAQRVHPAHVALGVADDLAYSLGLWWGALRSGRLEAIAPKISVSTHGLLAGLREALAAR
jgi:mycofactocin system glycosyltransferase